MNKAILTVLLLVISNTFMTFAWYGHLKKLSAKPFIIVVLVSWKRQAVILFLSMPDLHSFFHFLLLYDQLTAQLQVSFISLMLRSQR